MARLVKLEEDGPLGPAGTEVWVNDDEPAEDKPQTPRKAPAKKQASSSK